VIAEGTAYVDGAAWKRPAKLQTKAVEIPYGSLSCRAGDRPPFGFTAAGDSVGL
jgi:hypothetical protein